MYQADNPTSPLFLGLLFAILLDAIFAWSGIVRGELPNIRTSLRGARIGGILAVISGIFVLLSFRFFYNYLEFYGMVSLALAGGLFLVGILLAERIPD